jgi:reverse transcriptase-like protein
LLGFALQSPDNGRLMALLQQDDLDFARAHLQHFYASDFFPDPDELNALWACWDDVLDYHQTKSIASLGQLPRDLAATKAGGGFRMVHQLVPIDTVTYTALAHRIAPYLEAQRLPLNDGVVCSYRIDINATGGRFFIPESTGYDVYRTRSADLSNTYQYVLLLDIAGFYNHIYLHRVQGTVEQLDGSLKEISTELEQFLLNTNKRLSIGIPVGPAASVILAETILHDIDLFIQARRPSLPYTRYADDFRVFSDSKSALNDLWHDLTRYLYRSHRLSLATDKSSLMESGRFRDQILNPPGAERQRELGRALGISFEDLVAGYAGMTGSSAIDVSDATAKREALQELFEIVLRTRPLNIGAARKILRRARTKRMRAILQHVLRHFETLAPVIRDVGLYLSEVLKGNAVTRNEHHLSDLFARHPRAVQGNLPHEWLAWLVTRDRTLAAVPQANTFLETAPPTFQARLSRLNGRIGWVRERSAEWSEFASWSRWALLASAVVLPDVERRIWMDHVLAGSTDFMDRVLAKYVKSL